MASTAAAPELFAIATQPIPQPAVDVTAERAAIASMRAQRVELPAGQFQVMRGEFHRHTEISADGGADGPLIDAYRYLIDAAGWIGAAAAITATAAGANTPGGRNKS
jgi:hypothetical protein